MEDFFYQFFVGPFVELGSGFASAGTGDATWIEDIVATVDGFVWGPIMILLLLGTHIFMTFRTGFIQRKIPQGIKLSVTKDSGSGDVSPFAALTTSLAATQVARARSSGCGSRVCSVSQRSIQKRSSQ